ncbi:hypothetical protein LCGC14_2361470, partial [marine sediment metagenome]
MTIPRCRAVVIAAVIGLGPAGWAGPARIDREASRNRPQWGLVLIRGMDGWVACGLGSRRTVWTPNFAIVGPVPYEINGYVSGQIREGVLAIDHNVKRVRHYRVGRSSGIARLDMDECSFLEPRWGRKDLPAGPAKLQVVANVLNDDGMVVRDQAIDAKVTVVVAPGGRERRYRIDIPYRPGLVGAALCDSKGGRIADLTHDPDVDGGGRLVVTSLAKVTVRDTMDYRGRDTSNPARARA